MSGYSHFFLSLHCRYSWFGAVAFKRGPEQGQLFNCIQLPSQHIRAQRTVFSVAVESRDPDQATV